MKFMLKSLLSRLLFGNWPCISGAGVLSNPKNFKDLIFTKRQVSAAQFVI